MVEEPVLPTVIEVQITSKTELIHALAVFFGRLDGDMLVFGSQKNDRGRHPFVDIVQRRKLLPVILYSIMPVTVGAVVENRIK
jgi:hypothetical protein